MRMGSTPLFVICAAIWGSTWLAIKYQLGVVAPELSVAYRFGLAATMLFAWCMATRRSLRFSAREHGYLAALGVMLFGLNYIGIYWAERFVTSGLVAVRNHKAGIPTFQGTAWGMTYGALSAALASVVHGVPWSFDTSPAYLLSLAYLSLFGSIIAFGA